MLKTDTVTIDGENYEIRQASVYRVIWFQKESKKASEQGEAAVLELCLDLLKRCVVKSDTDHSPRFERLEDFDEISLPQMLELQNAIIKFSSASAENIDKAVEEEAKN